jgi:hypothetical protein
MALLIIQGCVALFRHPKDGTKALWEGLSNSSSNLGRAYSQAADGTMAIAKECGTAYKGMHRYHYELGK